MSTAADALMAPLTMQAAAVRAEAGEVERVRELSRWVAWPNIQVGNPSGAQLAHQRRGLRGFPSPYPACGCYRMTTRVVPSRLSLVSEEGGRMRMRKLLVAAFVVAAAFAVVVVVAPWDTAEAVKPEEKGNGLPIGAKRVFSFNLAGTPGEYRGGCGSGHRIFVNRNVAHAHIRVVDHPDAWHIEDCNATGGGDGEAEIHSTTVGDSSGQAQVWIRLLGKPGGNLKSCAKLESVHLADDDFEGCVLGLLDLDRNSGQSKFNIKVNQLFDASVQDVI